MDNNPFRSNNTPSSQFNGGNTNNGYTSPGYGQQPQQPYGYSTQTGFSQQQQPQPQQGWQNNMSLTGPNTPYSPITSAQPLNNAISNNNTSYQPYNQQQPVNQQPFNQQQQSFTSTPYQSQPQLQQQPYSPYNSNNTSSLMSSNATTTANSMSGGVLGNTYQPYQAAPTMPTADSYQAMYGNNMGMQQPQYNNNSNFYIPPNFGQSTTNTTPNANMYQPQQPRHAPVDASSLLKGTQVRRVECPVCQKMIEGDDMAVNHHVNEHYS